MENALAEKRQKQLVTRKKKFRPTRVLLHAIIILFIITVLCPLMYTFKLSIQDTVSAY